MVKNHQEIQLLPIAELNPYRLNAKKHPPEQIKKIIRSIELTGFDQPVVVNQGDMSIIKGHGRLMAAREMGLKEVPVIVLNVEKSVADKARLLDNKSAEGEYDIDLLLRELSRFQADIDDTGYSQSEFDQMIREMERDIARYSDDIDNQASGTVPFDVEGGDRDADDYSYSESENMAVRQGGLTKEINPDDFEFKHTCPKCGFGYND